MNVNSSNTCMICFGKESRITLKEYMSICKATPTEIPEIIEVIQKEPIDLGHGIMSHERYIGRNMVTVPGQIQQADWMNTLQAGANATHVLVLFPMHGSVDIPIAEFGKLVVTDNHMSYEQACMINEEDTIQRIHNDKGTQDSCWIHKSELNQTQGIFYKQCVCCRAVFDGINTVSLLPAAPIPIYDDNIDWMEDSDVENARDESEDEEVLHQEWKDHVIDLIAAQYEDMAIIYLTMVHSHESMSESLPDDFLSFMMLAIKQNCMRVFDCVVTKYLHQTQHTLQHRQSCMRKCLVYAVETQILASTLQHVIHSELFCEDSELWQNVFTTLFKSLDGDGAELVLSKFEILLRYQVTPLSTIRNRQYYAAFDGFLEWCVCTSATTFTFATGFASIVAAFRRLQGVAFNMDSFRGLETILLICRNKEHLRRVALNFFSAQKIGTILRMLQYYEDLTCALNTCNWDGCNAFFYVTNPEIMDFLFSKGVDPAQKDKTGQNAIVFIMNRVCQDTILFEHTQCEADELYSCISKHLSYKFGLDDKNLAAASSLVKILVFHRPVFQRLESLSLCG